MKNYLSNRNALSEACIAQRKIMEITGDDLEDTLTAPTGDQGNEVSRNFNLLISDPLLRSSIGNLLLDEELTQSKQCTISVINCLKNLSSLRQM